MTSKAILTTLLSLNLFGSSLAHADEAPAEQKPVSDGKGSIDTQAEVGKAKEDCDTAPKVKPELDPKALEQKAAEKKALENLGLVTAPPVKANPVVPLPTAKMETCK